MRERYRHALRAALATPFLFSGCFLAFCVLSTLLVFVLGRDFFPSVDAGQIRLHFRARTGLRIEETARLSDQIDGVIRKRSRRTKFKPFWITSAFHIAVST